MDYAGAVAALEGASSFGIHPSLAGITALTDALGRPQDAFSSVQVTGTNGKTSVTRVIGALLHSQGLRTLNYTSPHLESYTERIEIDGELVSEATFALAAGAALGAASALGGEFTEFELLTAAALWLARESGCAWAVLEVGMGGRWDATSVVSPRVAVVTGVGLDHMDRLGGTLEAIAHDKAHIIKEGSTAVLGPGTEAVCDEFVARALGVGAPVIEVRWPGAAPPAWTFDLDEVPDRPGGRTRLTVHGSMGSIGHLEVRAPSYQASNVATAVAAVVAATGHALDPRTARAALADMTFPGRFELVAEEPPVVLDGAHNPQAAAVLAEAIEEAWPDRARRPVVVLGVLADKDAEGIVRELARVVSGFVVTQPDSPRALPAPQLADLAAATGVEVLAVEPDVVDAVTAALRESGPGGIVVAGSLYTVGQARASIHS